MTVFPGITAVNDYLFSILNCGHNYVLTTTATRLGREICDTGLHHGHRHEDGDALERVGAVTLDPDAGRARVRSLEHDVAVITQADPGKKRKESIIKKPCGSGTKLANPVQEIMRSNLGWIKMSQVSAELLLF